MAAKTYLLEKKFMKAINILTDLCYVIPPDMMNIGENTTNLISQFDFDEDENMVDNGGIKFCKQVLEEGEYEAEVEDEEGNLFKNRIIIDGH